MSANNFNERLSLGMLAGKGKPADDGTGGVLLGGGRIPSDLGVPPPPGQPSPPFFPPRNPPIPPIQPNLDVPRFQGPQTSTILARSAFALLEHASKENLELALNTLANRNIPADRLIGELERSRFSFQQILSELARGWRPEDVNGFAEKFGMPREQLEVMDVIVSLAILNDPTLESRLRAENQAPASPTDFLSSRQVIWQSVEPGSVLNPPYVILLAVEAVDTGVPDDVVQAILGQLDMFRNYKLPKAAVARLSGGTAVPIAPVLLNPQIVSLLANRPSRVALRPEG